MKKTLIIFTVSIVILLVLGISFLLLRPGATTPATDGGTQTTFNPFGIFGDDTGVPGQGGNASSTNNGQTTGVVAEEQRAQVFQVSESPVAGSVFTTVINGTSSETFVRYVERETGHIIDYSIETGIRNRISNTTIPRIREALWGNNGATVALRYLTEDGLIETFLGTIATSRIGSGEDSLLSGSFLPKDISVLAVHPYLPKTFYLTKTSEGGVGYVVSGGITEKVFSHPFSQWQVSWSGNSSLLMTTAPSYRVTGNAFLLNTTTGTFDRVASSMPALTALPDQQGSHILFGSVGQTGLRLSVFDVLKRQESAVSVGTLPEKCAWVETILYCGLPNAQVATNLPDNWYQGVVTFSDELWEINSATEETTFIFDSKDYTAQGVDMVGMQTSSDGKYLSFINKKDGSLWLVNLSL